MTLAARDAPPLVGATLLGAASAYGIAAAWEPASVLLLWGAASLALAAGVLDRLARPTRA